MQHLKHPKGQRGFEAKQVGMLVIDASNRCLIGTARISA